MAIEIERKYRITHMTDMELPPGVAIEQGYLATGTHTVRVRLRGESAFVTIKCPLLEASSTDALACQEFEYDIPVEDARAMLSTVPDHIAKARHVFDSGVELDIFRGPHDGLILAEFESADGAHAPAIPGIEWVEVTADRRYSNAWMAKHGVPPTD